MRPAGSNPPDAAASANAQSGHAIEMKKLSEEEAAVRDAIEREMLVDGDGKQENRVEDVEELDAAAFPNGGLRKRASVADPKKSKQGADVDDGESALSTFQMATALIKRASGGVRPDGGENGGGPESAPAASTRRVSAGTVGGWIFAVLVHAYLGWAIGVHWHDELDIEWCDGLGFVLIWVLLFDFGYAVKFAMRTDWWQSMSVQVEVALDAATKKVPRLADILTAIVAAAILIFAVTDALVREPREPRKLISLAGE